MTTGPTEISFARPPVRGVSLALYFEPLATLQVSHLSRLREAWRDQYPEVAELPPLRPLNRGGDESSMLDVGAAWPFPYVMFSSTDEQNVIAVQNDRLIRTWAFADDGQTYPGFKSLRDDLVSRLEQFSELVSSELGQDLTLVASECIYTNELPELAAEALLVGVVTQWTGQPGIPLPKFHYAGVRLHLDDDDEALVGTLMLDAEQADSPELVISTRYFVDRADEAGELAGLDRAHNKLIEHFLAFTSEEMQRGWERLT